VAVVSFQPGSLDVLKLSEALYTRDRIAGMTRGGLRISPHIYNSMADIERTLAAIRKYMSNGS